MIKQDTIGFDDLTEIRRVGRKTADKLPDEQTLFKLFRGLSYYEAGSGLVYLDKDSKEIVRNELGLFKNELSDLQIQAMARDIHYTIANEEEREVKEIVEGVLGKTVAPHKASKLKKKLGENNN